MNKGIVSKYLVFLPSHPLWLVGFRPFFLFALLLGAFLPFSWALVFSGKLSTPHNLPPMVWHSHEMFFGFGGAVLGGFLLTASKNWLKIRGLHGLPLMFLAGLWIVERLTYWGLWLPPAGVLAFVAEQGFTISIATYLIGCLWIYRKQDSYKDNIFFILLLLTFCLTHFLFHEPTWYQQSIQLTLGLFRLAFVVMFERTLIQFMKGTEKIELFQNPWFDLSLKALTLLCAFDLFLPSQIASLLLFVTGSLLLVRWFLWTPWLGLRQFGNGIMYVGLLALALHFISESLKIQGILWGTPSSSLHLFSFFCMGTVIPGMFVRICQGHTGRKPSFEKWDKIAISFVILSGFLRLILPLFWMEHYPTWITLAALCWFVCYAILARRFIPFLLTPRIDGKTH